jgi:hypothetical protein
MSLPPDAQHVNALQAVQEQFLFRNDQAEVWQFLQRYPFLVMPLLEARRNIMKYFPSHSQVYLTVATDPEDLSTDQLVVSIATDLDPEQATNALDAFDEHWWWKSLRLMQGKLCITLELL